MELLRKVRALPKVKKVFIRSGIRYDYLMQDPRHYSVLKEIIEHHVSGQLKVAPEHVSPKVLAYMGKPRKEVYLKFKALYEKLNKEIDKKQFLVPYFISSHPGATLEDAVALSEFLRDHQHWPEQVQDFIPTPGSLATAMYWSGLDPLTGEEIFVARTGIEKIQQRVLLQPKLPQNRKWVLESLRKAGREDLIGTGPKCLVADFYNGKKKEEEALPEFTRKPRKFATKSKKGSKGKSNFSKQAGNFSKAEERTEVGSKPFAKGKSGFGKTEKSFSSSGESIGRGVSSSSSSGGFKGKRTEKSESSWAGESRNFSDKPRSKSGFGKKEGSFSKGEESGAPGIKSGRPRSFKGKRAERSDFAGTSEPRNFSDKPRGKTGFGTKEGSFSKSEESGARGVKSGGYKGKKVDSIGSEKASKPASRVGKPKSGSPTKASWGKKEGNFSGGFTAKGPKNNRKR